jgi:type I restriction enzyme S subunit
MTRLLRYLNSISGKHEGQFPSWVQKRIVGPEDAFVIAINPRGLGHEFTDADPPRILQAAFAVGGPYVVIDSKTSKAIKSGFQFLSPIKKASGKQVAAGVFLREEYSGLSGLLCSRVDAVNQPTQIGSDFQLVPNPQAKARLPDKFRLKGTYFRIEAAEGGYIAVPE